VFRFYDPSSWIPLRTSILYKGDQLKRTEFYGSYLNSAVRRIRRMSNVWMYVGGWMCTIKYELRMSRFLYWEIMLCYILYYILLPILPASDWRKHNTEPHTIWINHSNWFFIIDTALYYICRQPVAHSTCGYGHGTRILFSPRCSCFLRSLRPFFLISLAFSSSFLVQKWFYDVLVAITCKS